MTRPFGCGSHRDAQTSSRQPPAFFPTARPSRGHVTRERRAGRGTDWPAAGARGFDGASWPGLVSLLHWLVLSALEADLRGQWPKLAEVDASARLCSFLLEGKGPRARGSLGRFGRRGALSFSREIRVLPITLLALPGAPPHAEWSPVRRRRRPGRALARLRADPVSPPDPLGFRCRGWMALECWRPLVPGGELVPQPFFRDSRRGWKQVTVELSTVLGLHLSERRVRRVLQ